MGFQGVPGREIIWLAEFPMGGQGGQQQSPGILRKDSMTLCFVFISYSGAFITLS